MQDFYDNTTEKKISLPKHMKFYQTRCNINQKQQWIMFFITYMLGSIVAVKKKL